MEIVQQSEVKQQAQVAADAANATIANASASSAATVAIEKANASSAWETATPDGLAATTPLHTQTAATLSPTSEYVRYLLLALPARYVLRGMVGLGLETNHYTQNFLGNGLAKLANGCQRALKIAPGDSARAEHVAAVAYNSLLGVGSLTLTSSYSSTVYKDIRNVFAEAVAMESGKSPHEITPKDLQTSDNRMVQKTMENFRWRTAKRVVTDLLFFPAALARSPYFGDLMVGGKAIQAFGETWKRKTTMFEDIVTFVNNKINPRNGLGQAINVGEVFDLYQHYNEAFNPGRMFTNVVERSREESARWAQTQPIFVRMTELMNLTYAYKHSSVIDPKTGYAVHQADFNLPKFIYLLGHDLIDVNKPEQTLLTIEVANRYGIPAVKEMQGMLAQGAKLAQVQGRYPVEAQTAAKAVRLAQNTENGVIAKGSTRQLDEAPATTIDAKTISAVPPKQAEVLLHS